MVAQFWSSLNVAGNVCTYIASVYTRIGRQGGFSYQKASKEENLRGLLKKGSVSRHLNIGRSDAKGQTKMTLHSIWKCGKDVSHELIFPSINIEGFRLCF
ncbi:hypothetical protein AVEN_132938-1 [Araneus ventricosus]|uniref:Uncharacterized protein n=1 Tax=Araneus ventricosus TaxID=182803 RepID=A0A4Y2WBR0_ARAVE|nr:hypothetical protein AVEN_132938-1 [Araneus ventricosus]